MRITIQRKPFLSTLAAFKSVLPSKSIMPILSTVRITASVDGQPHVTIVGTDLDTCATVNLDAAVDRAGDVCVDRKALHAAVKACTSETVEIATGDMKVTVTGGGSTSLHTMDAADYPKVPSPAAVHTFCMGKETLQRIMRVVHPACSHDETRYVLNGVFLSDGLAVATDGHRLHSCKTELAADAPRVIVPRRAWNAFDAFLPNGGWLALSESHATLLSTFKGVPSIAIVTRLIEGRFPDYVQVMPKRWDSEARFDVKALAPAMKAHAALAKEGRNSTRFYMNGSLALTTTCADKGTAEHAVDVERRGPDAIWGGNPRYVLDALACFDKGVALRVTLDLDKETGAFKKEMLGPFEFTDDNGTRCVVMPVRI